MDLDAGIPEANTIYSIGGIIDDECMKQLIESEEEKLLIHRKKVFCRMLSGTASHRKQATRNLGIFY
jgi:hypothetical protein